MPDITQICPSKGKKKFSLPRISLCLLPHFSTLLHGKLVKYLNELLLLLLYVSHQSPFNQDFFQIILLNSIYLSHY